jgi:hypothetical protein
VRRSLIEKSTKRTFPGMNTLKGKSSWVLLAAVALWGCEGSAVLVPVDEELGEPAVLAPDDGTGETIVDEEADPVAEDCALTDTCPEALDPVEVVDPEDPSPVDPFDPPAAAAGADAGSPDAGSPPKPDAGTVIPAPTTLYVVNAKLLVRTWTYLRTSASSTASVVSSIDPNGGVADGSHGSGMPKGMLSPGQVVVLQSATKSNGFWKVKYDGATGYIAANRVAALNPAWHPVSVALAYRNAFFKHQLHRTAWNKDGPYSSGTCAPTSLAMAARIFGKEPSGLSIEESIHRSRKSYGVSSDAVGTNRYQIRTGALNLGLSVATHSTVASPSAMLTRIDGQLAKKRVFVLEGQSGDSSSASRYQAAFNRKYSAAGVTRRYTFDGRHSIAVFGRDAATGGYVVADPISEVGVVVLTGPELKDFFTRWGGTGNSVWAP